MKTILKSIVKPPIDKKKMVNFRANENEIKAIKDKADKFTDGNLSAWIIYAALNHSPAKKELVRFK